MQQASLGSGLGSRAGREVREPSHEVDDTVHQLAVERRAVTNVDHAEDLLIPAVARLGEVR
jgi:hypothetical protein